MQIRADIHCLIYQFALVHVEALNHNILRHMPVAVDVASVVEKIRYRYDGPICDWCALFFAALAMHKKKRLELWWARVRSIFYFALSLSFLFFFLIKNKRNDFCRNLC